MERIKLELNATSVTLLVAASIFILLYLIQVADLISEEFQSRVGIVAGGIVFIAFLCEMFIDIIKQNYTTIKYIVLVEIIGIISWSVVSYTSMMLDSMPIYAYDCVAVINYRVAAEIIFFIMLYTRGFLKSKRFEKNKKMIG